MKANELRIGNWVYDLDPVKTPRQVITINSLSNVDYIGFNQEEANQSMAFVLPIALTEEWLERFGFVEARGVYELGGVMSFRLIQDPHEENEYTLSYFKAHYLGYSVYVNYVHTLQNLYFALTGEELTLKNEA